MGNRELGNLITNYRLFETNVSNNGDAYKASKKDYVPIVGIPSGEYLEIPFKLFDMLLFYGAVAYDHKWNMFAFDDKEYRNIKYYISTTESPKKQVSKKEDQKRKITKFFDDIGTKKYKINDDNTVDVYDDVTIREPMNNLPCKFDWVGGDFNISSCGLITLKGCPDDIDGDFICTNNRLTDLQFGPQNVKGAYDVRQTGIYSLKGAPRVVRGDFDCSYNNMSDLKEGPVTIDGSFYCSNGTLTSVEGAPDIIGGNFDVSYNLLTDLYDGPVIVEGVYNCSNNDIRNLDNGPKRVGTFKCNGNPKLRNFDNAPLCNKIIKDEI